jgi:hypothetical protein
LLEKARCPIGRAQRRVGAAELRVDVGTEVRRDAFVLERRLEALDSVEMIAAVRGCKSEPDRSAARGGAVSCGARFREDFLEQLLGRARVGFEPKLELCIRKLQLTVVDFAEVPSRFQLLDRDPELLGELPQRLDRRRACTRLDPGDVGV